MQELANIFIKSIFIDNMVFAYFLGMCSYLAISKTVKTSVGMGFAVIFVLGFTVPIKFFIGKICLKPGALTWISDSFIDVDLSFLSFIMFIAIIASMVQLVEMIVEKISPALYGSLGIFLPLIAVNCAILGGSLFMQERAYNHYRSNSLWLRLWNWLVFSNSCYCSNSRKNTLFSCTCASSWIRYYIYYYRSYGYWFYELYGYKIINFQ